MAVPIDAQIAEVAREIVLRRNAYKGFVERKRMTQQEADQHTANMEAVIATLNWVRVNREAIIKAVQNHDLPTVPE